MEEAIARLRGIAESVRVLGSYPVHSHGNSHGWRSAAVSTISATMDSEGPGVTASSSRTTGGRVLVLNASFEPINVCTVRRAAVLDPEAEGGGARGREAEAALRADVADATGGDPAGHVRASASRRAPAQDHPQGGARARLVDLPVLRHQQARADRRPRRSRAAAVANRCGRTSSPPARRATARREIGCRARSQMHPRQAPRAPGPHVFIRIAAPASRWSGSATWCSADSGCCSA